MPDVSQFLSAGLVLALVVLMFWFALGTGRNVSRGNALLRWLESGLPLVGKRTTLRWLGSSVVELRITEPLDPFREATVLAVLEPRDLSWIWALARGRGRRDFLIVRTSLRRAPRWELEVDDDAAWSARDVARRLRDEEPGTWREHAWGVAGVEALVAGNGDVGTTRAHWERLRALSDGVWRLAIRRTVPHLEVHLRPPDLERVSSDRLFREVRELAVTLARE